MVQDNVGWTDENVALLIRLWDAGLSTSQIAARIPGATRNSVIGKIHRLSNRGESLKRATTKVRRPERLKQKPVDTKGPQKSQQERGLPSLPSVSKAVTLIVTEQSVVRMVPKRSVDVIPYAGLVPFIQLEKNSCKWPVEGSGMNMLCCARATADGKSYCPTHETAQSQPSKKGSTNGRP